jgi:hypothetical protein
MLHNILLKKSINQSIKLTILKYSFSFMLRQMVHAPNGTRAKWYTRLMVQAPNGTGAKWYTPPLIVVFF